MQLHVNNIRIQKKFCKENFHYEVKLFEPKAKTFKRSKRKQYWQDRLSTKAIEYMPETNAYVKASKSLNKIGHIVVFFIVLAKIFWTETKFSFSYTMTLIVIDGLKKHWMEENGNFDKSSFLRKTVEFSLCEVMFLKW